MINNANIYRIGLGILIILIGIDFVINLSIYWYILPIGLVLIAIAVGSFIMSYNFFLKSITKISTIKSNKIALTFDDGPNSEYTIKVLDILDKYDAKATFFCIGKNIRNNPSMLKSIIERGHAIGNHSFSHHKFIGFSTSDKWIEEIEKTDNAIFHHTGLRTKFFRPPFGVTTPQLAKALRQTGHKVFGWNIRSFDTVTKNPHEVLERIYKKISPGSIVLLHDTHNRIPFILEHLLLFLKENDYLTVTLESMENEM